MWYWYIARSNELLIDIDQPMRITRRGGTWLQEFFYDRLAMARMSGLISVALIQYVSSATSGHAHIYLRLSKPMSTLKRLIWQLQLGSDLYRGRADMMRYANGSKYPSLLIEPDIVHKWRKPDFCCNCKAKHVTGESPSCKVWLKVRGSTPWELFGRPLT